MAGRTALTPFVPSGSTPALQPGAGSLDLTWASDQPNGNSVVSTGRELILVNNSDVGAHTVTITSVANTHNRTGDITAYSVGAGKTAVIGPLKSAGWAHSGLLYLDCSDATVTFAVIQLPSIS